MLLGTARASTEQGVTVIATFEAVPEFIAALKDLPRDRQMPFYRRQLYLKHVLNPYRESCEMEHIEEDTLFLPFPRGDLDELSEAVRVLQEAEVERRVVTALERSAELLPGPDVVACLFVHSDLFMR